MNPQLQQQIFELGQFLVARGSIAHVPERAVLWAFDCSILQLRSYCRSNSFEINFKVLRHGGTVSWIPASGADLKAADKCPDFLLQKISTCLLQPVRALKRNDFLLIADWWRHIADFIAIEELKPNVIEKLTVALDFSGQHCLAEDLVRKGRRTYPYLTQSAWAEIRGAVKRESSRPEVAATRALETLDMSTIERILRQIDKDDFEYKVKLKSFAAALFALASVVFAFACSSLKRIESIQEDLDDLDLDTRHWQLSAQTLAAYWVSLRAASRGAALLVENALISGNPMAVLRSLDWWFMTTAHLPKCGFLIWFYPLLISMAQRLAPFLVQDMQTHYGSLLYCKGRFREALIVQSYAEVALSDGRHPFNREGNRCNALRSASFLNNARITYAIFNSVAIETKSVESDYQSYRAKLLLKIQRVREDGLRSNGLELLSLYEKVKALPATAKGDFELLLTQTYLELGDFENAYRFSQRAKASLTRAQSLSLFKKRFQEIETQIKSKATLRKSEAEVVERDRLVIAVNFNDNFLASEDSVAVLSDLNCFFSAVDTEDLFDLLKSRVRLWLPEFRVAILGRDGMEQGEGIMPADETFLRDKFKDSNSPIFSKELANGRNWMFVGRYIEEIKIGVVFAAPECQRSRFPIASHIENSFLRAYQNILAERLHPTVATQTEEFSKTPLVYSGVRLPSELTH